MLHCLVDYKLLGLFQNRVGDGKLPLICREIGCFCHDLGLFESVLGFVYSFFD